MSEDIKITPSGRATCPNHGCELEGIPFPIPEKGTARCPVSTAMFEYEAKVDPQIKVQLKDGTITKKSFWEVKGEEK